MKEITYTEWKALEVFRAFVKTIGVTTWFSGIESLVTVTDPPVRKTVSGDRQVVIIHQGNDKEKLYQKLKITLVFDKEKSWTPIEVEYETCYMGNRKVWIFNVAENLDGSFFFAPINCSLDSFFGASPHKRQEGILAFMRY